MVPRTPWSLKVTPAASTRKFRTLSTWLGLLAAQSALLASCLIPIPWTYHRTPDLAGVITRGGVPVSSAKVGYSTNSKVPDCRAPVDEGISSADGTFYLHGTRSFFHVVFFIPAPLDYGQRWHLCVDASDGQRFDKELEVVWGGPIVSMPSETPGLVTTKCDLSSSAPCFAHP
jgi:hypothetical protein